MPGQRSGTDTGIETGFGRRTYLQLACAVAALAGCSGRRETVPYGAEEYGQKGYG